MIINQGLRYIIIVIYLLFCIINSDTQKTALSPKTQIFNSKNTLELL